MTHSLTTPGQSPWYNWTLDPGSNAVNPGDVICSIANGNARRADNGLYIPAIVGAPNNNVTSFTTVAQLSATAYVVGYTQGTTAVVVIATVSGTAVTIGTPLVVIATPVPGSWAVAALSATSFVIGYGDGSSGIPKAIACTVSGTTITAGSPASMNATGAGGVTAIAALSSTSFVMAYEVAAAHAQVCTVSGTTITLGTDTGVAAGAATSICVCPLTSTSFAVAFANASPFAAAVVCTVSGSTITAGTPVVLNAVSSSKVSIAQLDSTDFVVAWLQATFVQAITCSVSGTVITPGTQLALNAAASTTPFVTSPVSTTFVVAYADAGNSIECVVCTQSAGVITAGTPAIVVTGSGTSSIPTLCPVDTTDVFLVNLTVQTPKTVYGGVVNFNGTTVNSTGTKVANTVGMAVNACSPGGTVTVATGGQLTNLPVTLTPNVAQFWDRIVGLLGSTTNGLDKVGFSLNSNTIIVNGGNAKAADQWFG